MGERKEGERAETHGARVFGIDSVLLRTLSPNEEILSQSGIDTPFYSGFPSQSSKLTSRRCLKPHVLRITFSLFHGQLNCISDEQTFSLFRREEGGRLGGRRGSR